MNDVTAVGRAGGASGMRGRGQRWALWRRGLAILVLLGGLATVTAPVAGAAAANDGPSDGRPAGTTEDVTARAAVLALTGDHSSRVVVPSDFAASAGYLPTTVGSIAVNPSGECSSPVPLPAEFDTACKAHDLGYDLLRYADRHGAALGPWARKALDDTLEQRMFAACADRTATAARLRCTTMAAVATAAVDLNSVRQHYAAPRPEHFLGAELSGAESGPRVVQILAPLAMVLLMVAALFAIVRRTVTPRTRLAGGTPDRPQQVALRLGTPAWRARPRPLARQATRPAARQATRVTARRFAALCSPRIGTIVAVAAGIAVSLAPGLLPRTSMAQAILTALLILIALAIAGIGRKILARFDFSTDRWVRHRPAVVIVSIALVTAIAGYDWYWQNRLRSAMEFPALGPWYWLHWAVGVVVVVVPVLGLLRGLRWAAGYAGRVPTVAAIAVTVLAGQFAVLPALVDRQQSAFAAADTTMDPAVVQPVSHSRSGSMDSEVSWASLGAEGRKFVSEKGDSARVYIGLDSAPDLESRIALALREIERAGGFRRGNLVLMVPTGSGWLDANAAHGLDERFDGDATLVGMQYSQAPSWATFLFARADAERSARELFTALETRLATMDHPPKLYVYGQSLGATAGSAIFADDQDESSRVCAALWAGPPASAVHRGGATVLANSSDPVVQWSPRLLWRAPDLTGTRPDAPHPPWLPVVSWVQTTADMLAALAPGPGHGHRYGSDQGTALGSC